MTNKILASLFVTLVLPVALAAQERTVTIPSGTEYERSGLWRALYGETWRDVWGAPITVPVLDLDTYAGGLTPYQAGGNQSRTLRMRGADGRIYMFRSTNKDVQRRALPEDLRYTPVGGVIQDQTSSMHPTGSLPVAVLQEAVGLLHAPPALVYMPDHPRLGEFRKDYANMLGQIEERPEDAEDAEKPFAGAEKIHSTEKLLENLEESMEDYLNSREYLMARLIDFIVGDTDRGADQWRFAKFERGDRDEYRPIPRDRDYAFMESAEGLLMRIGAKLYPKVANYGERYSPLRSLVFMTREFDRSHLIDLSEAQWDETVRHIQTRLTDDVIARAVATLPPPHRALSGAEIEAGLRARRDALPEVARQYYEMVNEDADIFLSDEDERAEIDRHADGTVSVRLWREDAGGDVATNGRHAPVFERRFDPAVTDEIRVFLERGHDRAVVRGNVERSIEVRVIGGEGDDVLIDSSHVANGDKTHFYDAHGDNTIVRGARTRVVTRPYGTPAPKCDISDDDCEKKKKPRVLSEERRGRQQDLSNDQADYIDQKVRSEQTRSWGQVAGWTPMAGYREGNGVVLGFGPTITDYGFRRRPYEWRLTARAMVGTMSGNIGLQLETDRYFETSPVSVSLYAHATQLESQRFYGFGNNTPLIGKSQSLIERDELLVAPQLRYWINPVASVGIGPVAHYVRPHAPAGSPAEAVVPADGYGYAGGRIDFNLDYARRTPTRQSGIALQANAAAYPAAWDLKESFSRARALARIYIPFGRPTLGLRAGGERVWGSFPLNEAALIGGQASLRGFSWNRYAGDAAAFGSAELRLPITRVTLLTRGDLGLLGFTDAGRVWLDGESEGGWHTSYGGGLFFGSLGQTFTVTYAKGEEGRVYLSYGFPF